MTKVQNTPGRSELRVSQQDHGFAGAQSVDAELRLPRPPGVFRRWLSAHPRTVDGVIVGVYLLGCILVVAFELIAARVVTTFPDVDPDAAEALAVRSEYLELPWVGVSLLIVAAVAIALAYRRRFPLAGVVLVSLLLFFEQGLLSFPNSVALVFLLYAVPVYRSVGAGWAAFGVAFVLSSIVIVLTRATGSGLIGPSGVTLGSGPFSLTDQLVVFVFNGLWLLAVLMIGINLGNRRRYVAALIDRAHQLAREREQRAMLAASAERARIAREMHDIVAHSLSVVVTLNEAAAVAIDTQPAAAKQAVERSAETGRTALIEMRRLLGVLDDESGGDGEGRVQETRSPQPGIAEIPALVTGFVDAGLRVSVTEQGVPQGDQSQQLAVYRISQEALTNALRHAGPGTEVALELLHDSERTRIIVTDSGPVSADAAHPNAQNRSLPGSGRGLEGARQRARIFGGDVVAGSHGTGWRVVATIPLAADEGGKNKSAEDHHEPANRVDTDGGDRGAETT